MNSADMLNLVWPLAFILVALVFVRQLRTDASPIIQNVISGLSQNASRNATQYAIAFAFGLSASCSAFVDVFAKLDSTMWTQISWHQYATLWIRVFNPFIVAVLAYGTQNNFTGRSTPSNNTPSPFATSTPVAPPVATGQPPP